MFFILLISAVVSRFLPHPANIIPIGAILMFAPKKIGYNKTIILAMLAMIISDIFIGFNYASPYVYIGMLGYVVASKLISKKTYSYFLASLSGSTFFFLVSNFGVWLGPWYEHNITGFIKCFTLALPFYKNTAIGDIAYLIGIIILELICIKIYNELTKRNKREEILWQS